MSNKEFRSTNYPSIVGSPYGWWHKPMATTVSLIILSVIVILIFLFGIWFTTQYLKIWSTVQAQTVNVERNVK